MQLDTITSNPVTDSILTAVGGLLAVLNDKRQIVTANRVLLEHLEIRSIECILGSRLGEAIECEHAAEMPGGCGTSRSCEHCGAVIAMMAGLEGNETREEICHIHRSVDGSHLCFSVRVSPMTIEGMRFLLVFLQDISADERWNAMASSFYHDLNNIIGSVIGGSELLKMNYNINESSPEASLLDKIIQRLADEVTQQKLLWENRDSESPGEMSKVTIDSVCSSLEDLFSSHPERSGKNLEVTGRHHTRTLFTNKTILLRVMSNMLINAIEASQTGDTIRLSAEIRDDGVLFSVWNRQYIPEEESQKIFHRGWSSKSDSGRGLGTFGMKLFGEKVLGGQVKFTTHPEEGTIFSLYLPTEER
ncbi:MAG: sensor histidine kinase [Spirochaetales bacterium]|nr:sensor histidine kinase [Spirochaetales bacterium]